MNLWIRCLSVLSLSVIIGFQSIGIQKKKGKSKKPKVSQCLVEVKQGIKGKIIELKGNQMPSPDGAPKKGKGVRREIGIFEATKFDQVVEADTPGFYKIIKSKKLKSLFSGEDGCFAIVLKPGHYSIFVRENGQWYANNVSGENDLSDFEISPGKLTELDFQISWQAYF